jgi:integrase
MTLPIKCLTPQEEYRFLSTLKNRKDAERAYLLYHLMLITGLRLSEALRLNVGHTSERTVEIKVKGWTQKGPKKERYKSVIFPKQLQDHLREFLRYKARKKEPLLPESPLFLSQKGNRLSPRQVQREFKYWLKETDLSLTLSPHALRHTVGTRLLKTFKNPKLVQRYLGHSDVTTTWKYSIDVFPEGLEAAAESRTRPQACPCDVIW